MGGGADTYDHNRQPMKVAKNNGKGKGNDSRGTFRIINKYRCVNCAELEEDLANGDDFDGDGDTSDYQRRHPLSQVNLDEINSATSEIEFGDIADWQSDSAVGRYSVNLGGCARVSGCGAHRGL